MQILLRTGPCGLILGSVFLFAVLLTTERTLRSTIDHRLGFIDGVVFSILGGLMLVFVQACLAAIFMYGDNRAWWRTLIVLFPGLCMSGLVLPNLIELVPHQRWARNRLTWALGAEVPPSVKNLEMEFNGDYRFFHSISFDISTADWGGVCDLPRYRASVGLMDDPVPSQISGTDGHYQFYLGYDPKTHRGKAMSVPLND